MNKLENRQSGMSVHCHHDKLFEFCYDLYEVVAMTKQIYPHFNPEVHKIESKIATVRTSQQQQK